MIAQGCVLTNGHTFIVCVGKALPRTGLFSSAKCACKQNVLFVLFEKCCPKSRSGEFQWSIVVTKQLAGRLHRLIIAMKCALP